MRAVKQYRNKSAFYRRKTSMDGGVEDDSGDENTKVKNSNNDAEEDNCIG